MERRGRRFYQRHENRERREVNFVKKYNPSKTPPTHIWRPCVPSWEKEFTSKIGNIKWEDFVKARKLISMYDKIMDWNDSACEEVFRAAKKRFWDHYNGYRSEVSLPDPDMHIDKNINWDSKPQENKQGEDLMLSVSDAEDELPKYAVNQMPGTLNPVGIEDIIPTGWDVDVSETVDSLTGLIVGDDNEDKESVLRDSMNTASDFSALRKFRQAR